MLAFSRTERTFFNDFPLKIIIFLHYRGFKTADECLQNIAVATKKHSLNTSTEYKKHFDGLTNTYKLDSTVSKPNDFLSVNGRSISS